MSKQRASRRLLMIESAEYLLPDEVEAAELSRALAPLDLRADYPAARERSFFDTFDGRLHRAGLTLVHEGGRLALLEGDHHERAGADWPDPAERLFPVELPGGRLRELLLPLAEVRALTRIARVRSRRRLLRVLNDEGKTVVRLVLEQPRLVRARDGALRPRLHAVGVRGYGKALARVRRRLEGELGLVAADVTLADEAVARTGGTPGGVSSKLRLRLEPRERADRAAAAILRRLLEVMEANLPGTLADVDSEFLHDLRVGVRRSRSLERQLRPVFPAGPLAHFRAEFRWIQGVTGPSRDLDVYVFEFDGFRAALPERQRPDLEPLRDLLVRRRARERDRMVRALRSPRTGKLFAEWAEFLAWLEGAGSMAGPDSGRPIAEVAGVRIAKVYRRMVRDGSEVSDSSPPEALHELRKKSKELRYLLEFFASLYPGRVIRPMVGTLKALQDTLGRFQDREVQAELVRSLGEDVRTLDDGAAALMAMGQLVERLEEQQVEARAEFADRFAAFASRRQRALVRETFA
jgi:CHAD domain-containing protein